MTLTSKSSYIVKITSTIAVIAMVLVSIAVYHSSIPYSLIFLAYLVFYVQLPGSFICRILGLRSEYVSHELLISFFTGWAMIIAEFFISSLLYSNILLYAAGPLLSAALLIISFKDDTMGSSLKRLKDGVSRMPAGIAVFAVILMVYVLFNTQYLYMSPEYTRHVYASIDKCYQMGLITSLSHGYPLVDPFVAGRFVNYHIFSQVLLSVPVALFGLPADFMVMSCSPYLTVYLISLSFYSLFTYFCKNKERAGLYTLSVIAANMFAARSITGSYLYRILFINDNYGGYAIACAFSWTILLGMYFRAKQNKDCGQHPAISGSPSGSGRSGSTDCPDSKTNSAPAIGCLLTAQMLLLCGIKAPVALVMTGGLIGTCLLGLILRKLRIKDIWGIVLLQFAAFYLVYHFLLGSGSGSEIGGSIFGFAKVNNLCFWKQGLIAFLRDAGVPPLIRLAAIMLIFTFSFFTAYCLPFAIGYIREFVLVVRGRKDYDTACITIYASALAGFILMLILRYTGHSQIYFGTVTAAFAPVIAFRFFEDVTAESAGWMRTLCGIAKLVFCITLVFTSLTLAADIYGQLPSAAKHADPDSKYNKYKSMSAEEYEAVKWIKDNTLEDSLIATQMYASVNLDEYDVRNRWHNCHFLYAAYSDRKYYLEGSGFTFSDAEYKKRVRMISNNSVLFDADDPERDYKAVEMGIDYVLVTKRLFKTPDLSSDIYRKVFSNKDADIYQISADW